MENFSWKDLATTRLPMITSFSLKMIFCNKLIEITGLHFTYLPSNGSLRLVEVGKELQRFMPEVIILMKGATIFQLLSFAGRTDWHAVLAGRSGKNYRTN